MNTLGNVFRITTWGESHGPAIGFVLDGCPAGLEISEEDIMKELEKDIPENSLGTLRHEPNEIRILSGIYEGKTLGTPICIAIYNKSQNSSDYQQLKTTYRPGHAEYTYHKKYGIYDHCSGGRASGRTCIAYLAAGAISKKILSCHGVDFESRIEELAGIPCTSPDMKEKALKKCMEIGDEGDSTGGIVSLKITGVPVGVGSPMFGKLHSVIIYALSTIGGVKGIECGLGFKSSQMTGSDFNDTLVFENDSVISLTNNSGGVLGGISTGMPLTFKISVKPTPSIYKEHNILNWKTKKEEPACLKGRFDKNFTPRVAPLSESIASIVIVDQMILSGHINPSKI